MTPFACGQKQGLNGRKKGYVVLAGKIAVYYNGRVRFRRVCEIVALPRFTGPDDIAEDIVSLPEEGQNGEAYAFLRYRQG